MTLYAVLLPGIEQTWAGGAELISLARDPHREAPPRPAPDHRRPYAETVEQLTGFYLVASEDLTDLLEVVTVLTTPGDVHGGIAVRACVDHSGDAP